MSALLEEALLPGRVPAHVPLPDVFRAQMTVSGTPVHGDLREIHPRTARAGRRDPICLLPGDYVLDADSGVLPPRWLRVADVVHEATGSLVRLSVGFTLPVGASRLVWVWRAVDVMVWACLGEVAS